MTIQINTLPLGTTPIPGSNWIFMPHPTDFTVNQCYVEISDEVLTMMARLEFAPEGQKLHAAIEQLVAEAKADPALSIDEIAARAESVIAGFPAVNPIQRMMAFSKAQACPRVLMALHRKIANLMVWTAIGCPHVEQDQKYGRPSDYAVSEGRELLEIWTRYGANEALVKRYAAIRDLVAASV